jgi:hypothetical protein
VCVHVCAPVCVRVHESGGGIASSHSNKFISPCANAARPRQAGPGHDHSKHPTAVTWQSICRKPQNVVPKRDPIATTGRLSAEITERYTEIDKLSSEE